MYPSIRCIRCDALLLSNRGVGGDRRDPHLPGAIEAVAQQVASGAARLLCLCAVATYIGRCIHSCWQARLGIGFACSVLFRLRAEVHVVGVDGSAGGGGKSAYPNGTSNDDRNPEVRNLQLCKCSCHPRPDFRNHTALPRSRPPCSQLGTDTAEHVEGDGRSIR